METDEKGTTIRVKSVHIDPRLEVDQALVDRLRPAGVADIALGDGKYFAAYLNSDAYSAAILANRMPVFTLDVPKELGGGRIILFVS